MIFQFPSTIQRSNSSESESNPTAIRTYHYKKSSTLPSTYTPNPPPPPPSRNHDSTSSFGSETADPPQRPKSTAPPPLPRDLPPKSPKRFWAFSTQSPPPLPAMPAHVRSSSTNSIVLGTGAEVVRRPSEAARTMKQRAKLDRSSRNAGPGPMALTDMEIMSKEFDRMMIEPTTAPLPSVPYHQSEIARILPATAPLRTKTSQTSFKTVKSRTQEDLDKRSTIRPAPRSQLPPIPFSHHVISHTTRPALGPDSSTIITLDFAFSTDERCKNDSVKLTWEVLKRGGGHLAEVVERLLGGKGQKQRGSLESERSNPDLTDGSSSEDSELDSEYGLEALLRDEYLQSLMLPDSPDLLKHFPPPPPLPDSFSITIPSSNKPRAQKRNQYAQQDKFPSPSSPYTARSHILPLLLAPAVPRNNRHTLKISTTAELRSPAEIKPPIVQYGTVTEINVLLLRDSMPYHIITQRLIAGSFVNTSLSSNRDPLHQKKVEEELRWLGMSRLVEELGDTQQRMAQGPVLTHKKSGVITGGRGYI